MRKFWVKRILAIATAFFVSVGGCYYCVENRKEQMNQEVSASASGEMVIPGGMPVGIYLETKGVLVVGTEKIEGIDGKMYEPAASLIKSGDYIIGLNEQEILRKSQLITALKSLREKEVVVKVDRDGKIINIKMDAVECGKDIYKLGVWVKDNAQGLGTITYLTSDSKYGALGHGIHDSDTGQLLDISKGVLYATTIKDIQKGEKGTPGGMEGIIVYNGYNVLGTIDKNTDEGIYGELKRADTVMRNGKPVEVAKTEEVREGNALIRCAVEGTVKEYKVKIVNVIPGAIQKNKTLEIEVTDERLLQETGGIVQGMSGSPILQNGKLVGAVTHVFVNDPTRGYGILMENMIQQE